MKLFLVLLLVVCSTLATHSQDWSKLPELPVWYEEVNGRGINMSYLPDFDTANGGTDAIYFGYGNFTNYNRYKGDTINMFSFDHGHSRIWHGDFNGDGITDYSTSYCMFYKGVKKFAPPQLPKAIDYDVTKCAGVIGTVADINNDGKDDMIYFESPSPDTSKILGALLLGNEDIQKMELVYLPFTEWFDFDESAQCLKDAYYLEGKGARIITMTWDKNYKNGKLHMWAVDIAGDLGKRTVNYRWLATLKCNFEPAQYIASFYTGIHIKNLGLNCFKLHPDTYNLVDDKFDKTLSNLATGSGGSILFEKAFRKTQNLGWCYGLVNNNECAVVCFEGSPLQENQPIARFPCTVKVSPDEELRAASIISSGDVNHDGINDIACTYTNGKRLFRIYLGIDGSTNVSGEDSQTTITINIQNPLPNKQQYSIHITSQRETSATLELYSLQGTKVMDVWNGELTVGENSISCNVQKYNLSNGMYNLRLNAGKHVMDKAIIIE
ncbi:MAG: T9SS type A sorting domain-containing protein [Candidatus Kapaibacterium sp.]